MRKILIILPNLRCGGAERVSVTFAKILFNDGFQVKIVIVGDNKGELLDTMPAHIELIYLNCKKLRYSVVKLYKLFQVERPDFVFSSLKYVSVWILFIGILFPFIKIILREPTLPSNKLFATFKARMTVCATRLLYKRAYRIIAQTEQMKSEIVEYYHLGAEKVCVYTNPVDYELIDRSIKNIESPFNKESRKYRYLAVGNISPAKGYDILLKAFDEMNDWESELYIIGRLEGEYAQKILELAKGLKSSSRIHFLGFISNPYLYMKYCDVYVLSSRMEGLPNVLLEAIYLRKKVVATCCVPFVAKVLENYSASILVEKENVDQLQQALSEISLKQEAENRDCFTYSLNEIFV